MRFRYWLVSSGMMRRIACGLTTRRLRLRRRQAERRRRLALPARHRLDAGAHDLRDEGRRIETEAEHQRDEFRQQPDAAAEIEALQFGQHEIDRTRRSDESGDRQHDDEGGGDAAEKRCARAREFALARRAGAARSPRRSSDQRGDADPQRARLPKPGCGTNRPRLLRKMPKGSSKDWRGAGQRLQNGVVPEQELQQQRHVAQGLDIDHRAFGDDPVLRKPRHADARSR